MGSFFSSLYSPAASTDDEKSGVITFHSSERWKEHFESSKDLNKLMVVDFFASWCGPCRLIEPLIPNFAAKYPDVEFVKIDVDELRDVSGEFGVQTMPTFVLLKQGKEVERVVGADKDELEQKILKHRELIKFIKFP